MIARRLLQTSFAILVAATAAMPGSALFGVKPAPILLAFFVTSILIYLVVESPQVSIRLFLAVAGFLVAAAVWVGVGLLRDETEPQYIIAQCNTFMGGAFFIFGGLFILEQCVGDIRLVFYSGLAGMLIYSTAKVAIVFGIAAGLLDPLQVVLLAQEHLNLVGVADHIMGGYYRFQEPNDSIAPILLGILVFDREFGLRINPILRTVAGALIALGIVFSFSRYLWIVTAASILFGAVWLWRPWLLSFISLVLAIAVGLSPQTMLSWIELRFSADAVDFSDSIRQQQWSALLPDVYRMPLMGKGFGGYNHELPSGDLEPYGYEVQWLAFLMQFGMLGVGLMLVYFLGVLRRLLFCGKMRCGQFLSFYFVAILASGLTNPYIMGRPFAYAVLLLVSAAGAAAAGGAFEAGREMPVGAGNLLEPEAPPHSPPDSEPPAGEPEALPLAGRTAEGAN